MKEEKMKNYRMIKMVSEMLIVAVLLAGVVGQPAYATLAVLDFEDLYPGYEDSGPLPAGYGGFDWSGDAWWITSQYHPGSGYDYGTIGNVSLFTAYANSISMEGASFDFLGAYITSAWDIVHEFTVEGWNSGSMVYSSSQITSNDKPYWFDFDFYDVDTIWIRPNTGNQLVIDNITLPEPGTVCLLGLGGLSLIRRRRR